MTEQLLQFIWQFQYFNLNQLTAVTGENIQIISPGQFNSDQGPDFNNAKIRIGHTTWAGTVELHIKTSDWIKHRHQHDNHYNNVILHVVWENDEIVNDVPVLELKTRVSHIVLQRYEELMQSTAFIPCENSLKLVPRITWESWKERLLAERMMRKTALITRYLTQNNYHWEETFWWLLARSFGMKVNAASFEAIARSLPLSLLSRQKHLQHRAEALLLGQAGLLEQKFKEDYPKLLQKEYRFMQRRQGIRPVNRPIYFLRMRPGNFPTVRLAQLASLVHGSGHLFSTIKEASSVNELRKWLDVAANEYWHHHYRFEELSSFKKKKLGASMIDNIIINTIIPVLFAYGHYHQEQEYKDKAIRWLEDTRPENNRIIRGFENIHARCKTAFDSQALLELKNEYCDLKKCLGCAVGNFLLRSPKDGKSVSP